MELLAQDVPWMLHNQVIAYFPLLLACLLFLEPPLRRVAAGAVAAYMAVLIVGAAVWDGPVAVNLAGGFGPVALAFVMSEIRALRRFGWPLLSVTFLAFLPNSIYLLTHSRRFVAHMARVDTAPGVTSMLAPFYVLDIVLGVVAYGASLGLLVRWLRLQGRSRWIPGVVLALHALVAVAIYLGRVVRANSWHLLQPDWVVGALAEAAEPRYAAFIGASFAAAVLTHEVGRRLVRWGRAEPEDAVTLIRRYVVTAAACWAAAYGGVLTVLWVPSLLWSRISADELGSGEALAAALAGLLLAGAGGALAMRHARVPTNPGTVLAVAALSAPLGAVILGAGTGIVWA